MAATLVFAVGAFFSSCRDHDEELSAEIHAQALVIAELNQNLSDAVADLKDEIDDVTSSTAVLPQVEEDIDSLEAKIEDLEAELEEKVDALQAVVDSLANLDHTVCNHVCDTCNHVCKECDHVCKECDLSALATKQALADSIAAVTKALNSAIAELAEKMATKEALQEVADSLASMKAEYDSLKNDYASFKDEYALHVELFNKLSTSLTDALTRLSTLESDYTTLKNKVDSLESTLQQEIAKVKGDLAVVQAKAAEADERSKQNETKIAVIESEIDDLKAYVDSLVDAKVNELEEEVLAVLQESVDSLGSELTEALKDSVAALRAEAAANLAEAKAYADEAAAAVAEELSGKLNETNATVAALQDAFKDAVAELQDQIDVLQEEVDELAYELDELEKKLDERLGLVEKEVEDLKKEDEKIKEDINSRISSIVLNGAYSPVVGYFSLPTGVKSNILAAYYGEANDFHFPTTRTVYNVAGSDAFTEADFDVLGIQETKYDGGVIVADGNNAGKLYVTFNPAEVSLEGKEFAFVNSLGEESPVKIDVDNVKKTEDKLTFGYTRAGAVALYEMPAKLAAEDVEAAKLRVELSEVKDLLQDVVSISDGFSVSDMATTLYAVVNDIADAQALQVTWTDAFDSTHTVYSDFGLATVALKPLSYNFLADVEMSTLPGYHKVMNVLNDIFDNIGAINIPNFGIDKLESISISAIEDSVKFNLITETETILVSVSTKELLDDLGDISLENLNKLIDEVNKLLPVVSGKIQSVENSINSIKDKIQKKLNSYLDKVNNKFCSLVNSFNAALQPTMLVSTVDGFSMLSSIKAAPTTIDNASAVLVPTSFSGEFLAPASKKYVAVTKAWKDGAENLAAAKAANTGDLNTVLQGNVREVAFAGQSGYTYEITYSAVDYYGMISTTKYYVKVK